MKDTVCASDSVVLQDPAASDMPPGSLEYVGTLGLTTVRVIHTRYNCTAFEERELNPSEESFPTPEDGCINWIHVNGLRDSKLIESIGSHYHLDSLVLEDMVDTRQRPKVEDHRGFIFIVVKMSYTDEELPQVQFEQISLILGPGFIISLQEGDRDCFRPIRERLKASRGRGRLLGADYLAYAILDHIGDNNFVVLDRLGKRIRTVEDEVLAGSEPSAVHEARQIKWDILLLRKDLWPFREVVRHLRKFSSPLIHEGTRPYIYDLYDHTIQAVDTLQTYQEMTNGFMDVYLSVMSQKNNQRMQVLTTIATIFMPLTFIAGFYGMNFDHMPELKWEWGYRFVQIFMACIAAFMFFFFKRKKWL
ncbi:MAG: magnesium/cobalt transporter CorA [Syntrophobacteraceae bacterium]